MSGRADPQLRAQRRAQIVAAARHIIAVSGLEALTFTELERHLGFTRGVITWHFRDKHEIILAVLDSAVDEIDEHTFVEANLGRTFAEKVRSILTTKVNGFLTRPDARQILVAFWATPVPGTSHVSDALFTRWRAQASTFLKSAQLNRVIAADVDCDGLAGMMVATVLGVVIQSAFGQGAPTAQMIDEATKMVVSRCLRSPARDSDFID